MSTKEQPTSAQALLEEALERGAREADPDEVADADRRLDDLLAQVAPPPAVAAPAPAPSALSSPEPGTLPAAALRTGKPLALEGRRVTLEVRGLDGPVAAELAPGVSSELVAMAVEAGDAVLVEHVPGEVPWVVGVLQTRIPDTLVLKGRRVHLEGSEEVLLRSGRGAVRIRGDGDIELVGSRIAAMSRGLFRLVGRVLRLN